MHFPRDLGGGEDITVREAIFPHGSRG
jgi:hypothetical protein